MLTTRQLINETALTYTKLLMFIQGSTDREIDDLLDKDDLLEARSLADGVLKRGQLGIQVKAWPQAEDRMHRVHYPEKPDEN
jgi:hypothetical protein